MVSVQHFYLFCYSWCKGACSTEQCCIWLVWLIAPYLSLLPFTIFIIRLKFFLFDSSLSPPFFLFFSFLALMNHDWQILAYSSLQLVDSFACCPFNHLCPEAPKLSRDGITANTTQIFMQRKDQWSIPQLNMKFWTSQYIELKLLLS